MDKRSYKNLYLWYLSSLVMALFDTPKTGEFLYKSLGEYYEILYQGILLSLSFLFSYLPFKKKGILLAPLHSTLFDLQSHLTKGELPYTQIWAIEKFGILGHLHETIGTTPLKVGYLISMIPLSVYLYLNVEEKKIRQNYY
jgi:hypothetical protein